MIQKIRGKLFDGKVTTPILFVFVLLVSFLIGLDASAAAGRVTLSIDPSEETIREGQETELVIRISGVGNVGDGKIYGGKFDLQFDRDIADVLDNDDIKIGTLIAGANVEVNKSHLEKHTLSVAWVATHGDGVLFRITFKGIAVGKTDVKFADVELYDADDGLIDNITLSNGKITVREGGRPAADRLAGEDRYRTAVEVSKEGWNQSSTVVLARGDEYADALAGAPLAHKLNAPILLTKTGSLNSYTRQEIKRLGASKVVILGGTAAISTAVENVLKKDLDLTVERIGGADRFFTAALISKKVAPNGSDQVFVVYGLNFPDALSASSYAARFEYPILLTRTTSLPAATKTELNRLLDKNSDMDTIAVGGTAVISSALYNSLTNRVRIWGDNRYETSVKLANYYDKSPSNKFYAATGIDFPDALTGGVLAGKNKAILLLVSYPLPKSVKEYLEDSLFRDVVMLGGPSAISYTLEDKILDLLE